MNNNNQRQNGWGDVAAYGMLVLLVLLTIGVGIRQVSRNSLNLQEEKTVFAMQSRLQDYFVSQLTRYKQVRFADKGMFKNLPRRDELVNLVTFLELIDKKTGNLGSIKVAESPATKDSYLFPSVLYTIELKGPLRAFNDYLSYLETLPYYYVIQRADWQDIQEEGDLHGEQREANQGLIQLLVFMKNDQT